MMEAKEASAKLAGLEADKKKSEAEVSGRGLGLGTIYLQMLRYLHVYLSADLCACLSTYGTTSIAARWHLMVCTQL